MKNRGDPRAECLKGIGYEVLLLVFSNDTMAETERFDGVVCLEALRFGTPRWRR